MNRRQWIQCVAGASLAAGTPARPSELPAITGFRVFTTLVNARSWVVFELRTDTGITGLGDATHNAKEPRLAASVARQLFQHIRGRSPFEIEPLRQAALPMVRSASARDKRPHAVAFAGIEQCMWDLQGKALGLPCYQLFGGKLHDKIRNYANINRMTRGADRTPEGFAASTRRALDAGFDAFKLAAFDHLRRNDPDAAGFERDTQLGIRMVEMVREVIGPKRDLLLDGHSRFTREQAIAVAARLERLNLFWLEEMCRPIPDLAAVNEVAGMPTAGGESLFGVDEFFPYIKGGAVDIVMPDMKFCGGMYELKKIAGMAEGAGMKTAPHGPASPIGNMAAAHVCATMPNFQILEFAYGEVPWRAEVVDPPEQIVNGYLTVPERPGIGYELNPKRWSEFND
jgi:galactonate dehydratase